MEWLDRPDLVPLALPRCTAAVALDWIPLQTSGWLNRPKLFELRLAGEPVAVLGHDRSFMHQEQWRAVSSEDDLLIETAFRGGSQYSPRWLSQVWIADTASDRQILEAERDNFLGPEPWSVWLGDDVSRLVHDTKADSGFVLKSSDDRLRLLALTLSPLGRARARGEPAFSIEVTGDELHVAPLCLASCCFAALALIHRAS
jgi:hypothetical protein